MITSLSLSPRPPHTFLRQVCVSAAPITSIPWEAAWKLFFIENLSNYLIVHFQLRMLCSQFCFFNSPCFHFRNTEMWYKSISLPLSLQIVFLCWRVSQVQEEITGFHHEKYYKISTTYYLVERNKRRENWCGNTVGGVGRAKPLSSKALFPGVHFPLIPLNIYSFVFLHPCNHCTSIGTALWILTFNVSVLWLDELIEPKRSTWIRS